MEGYREGRRDGERDEGKEVMECMLFGETGASKGQMRFFAEVLHLP